jgi:3-hydroxyisobutyrate dehydrogenase-like beta-hydroxyacid dehydrogenase
MDAQPALGLIGTGVMGAPMAEALLAAGHPVTVWNRSAAKAAPLLAQGAKAAATPAALAAACELVIICVTDAAAVEAVVFGADGLAAAAGPGHVLVDHSSIQPAASRALAARLLAATGAAWLDAPVSGGVPAIQARSLVVMAGGTPAAFARARPVLECYAGRVTLMGPSGAGQATKLINQVLVACGFVALAEACRLAENAGVEAALLPACLAGGRADSRLLQEYLPRMAARDRALRSRIALIVKDLDAVQEVASATATPMPLTRLAAELHRLMVAAGQGGADNAALIDLYGAPR